MSVTSLRPFSSPRPAFDTGGTERLANGAVLETRDPTRARAVIEDLFHAPLSARELGEALFVPAESHAILSPNAFAPRLDVQVMHETRATDTRDYHVAYGKTVMHQGMVKLAAGTAQGSGFGADTFAQALTASQRYGVDVIKAHAAGSSNGTDHVSDGALVGYYVWPRYGFNGPIPTSLRASMPVPLRGAKDLLELFATPEGPAWWKRHGTSVPVEFALDAQSPNVAAFQRYLTEKSVRS
jgi:hypothetical protein